MRTVGTIGAACLVAAMAMTSPALARGMGGGHFAGGGGAHFAGGGGHFAGGGARFAGGGFRGGGGGFHGRGFHGGIGPGIAAGVIAGTAIGGLGYYGGYTPYYGDSYAYDDDDGYVQVPYGAYNGGYACTPGTWFVGQDGYRHYCR